ncbi:formate/nitrite transporter family protein [Vallitalea okinawensis]|uniref:formate/nitrite transporter family protein n=1 Tax=Vallitalea okinawensis TaxID=2078660 RepID=UPI000CFA8562|nr:formate/nitrite transporter family protein [Vallitalea okinawensis]
MNSTVRTPKETYEYVIDVGIKKTQKTPKQSIINGVLAGIFIALASFAAAGASHGIDNYSFSKLISGIVFPVGLVMVILCGAELFTGNNLLAVGWFEKKLSSKSMLKNWLLVYCGNFIGIAIIVILIFYSGLLDNNEGLLGAYALKVASKKVTLGFNQAFIRGILCNILVCMAVWGAYTTRTTVGKVIMSYLPIMAFVISGFEHSIANMYYLTMGFLAKGNPLYIEGSHLSVEAVNGIDMQHILGNLIPVTLGNIVGGVLFVAGLYWLVNKKMSHQKAADQNLKKLINN